jgi:hypothetical protein
VLTSIKVVNLINKSRFYKDECFMKKSLFMLSIFFLFVLINSDSTLACSCMESPGASEELKNSKAVFSGRVISIKNPLRDRLAKTQKGKITVMPLGGDLRIKFAVEESWKNVNRRKLIVITGANSAACGYGFIVGERYLVYATADEKGILYTGICSRTSPLASEQARGDIEILGKGINVKALTKPR